MPAADSILLHLPHASTEIPEDIRADFLVEPGELESELLKLTDWFTDELFGLAGAERLVFGVSRLVVDPERFPDDAVEPMAERGMGAVYTRTSNGVKLRNTDRRSELMDRFYFPHHARLEEMTDRILRKHGRCLLVDCHSFPSRPLPCDQDQSPVRPLFCVGTDPYHTPRPLLDRMVDGLTMIADRISLPDSSLPAVWVDRPYSGTMVPASRYRVDSRVSSIMIEVNRSATMDERTGLRSEGFSLVRDQLGELLVSIRDKWIDERLIGG
jgi:N-formylglutamate deformylase